ncbi:MAG: leucyl aminopeptidase [Candidatus Dadabacteria bacterium]|nr:leucyl aminopeptidase [Candidatus Dadabacteria bacterium]NIQ13852.1 leucyl aminopeptidase [Candidatus Dadabacteria bacterium]
MIKYILKNRNYLNLVSDSLILLRFENNYTDKSVKDIDKKLKGSFIEKINKQKFDGQYAKSVQIDTVGNYKFKNILLIGLGNKNEFNYLRAFRIGNIINKRSRELASSIILDISKVDKKYLGSIIHGINIGNYEYNKHKTANNNKNIINEVFVYSSKLSKRHFDSQTNYARSISDSVELTRDLVNDPPNKLTPSILAEKAMSITKNSKNLNCKILEEDEIAAIGMGGLTAVSLGSDEPPRFIHLSYISKNKTKKNIAIVGKGITFDSGGLCLKPADSMRTMKMDMAGSAVVLGVMKAVSELKPNVNVHGIIPTTENMTGGSAYKPDDVITAFNGKTIEIINTDAEGRIALSDALSYSVENNMSEIIDLATLTGACIVGLGLYTAGVMGNNQKLIDGILKSAQVAGEKMWQLPLDEELRKEIKSSVADVKNVGSRWGGAITAALFLENFVGDTPWVHIDIAGPSFIEKQTDWYPYGATGFGVSTIVQYLMNK